MRITEAQLFDRTVRLPREVGNARSSWTERSGIWIRLSRSPSKGPVENRHQGWGEASPLPGYSPDSLVEARTALEGWCKQLPLEIATEEPTSSWLPQLLRPLQGASPAAAFAVETALLDLVSKQREMPLAQLVASWFTRKPAQECPLSALLLPGAETTQTNRLHQLLDQGFRSIKIKVGRSGHFANELKLLEDVRTIGGAELDIRLDANRNFHPKQVAKRLADLVPFSPSFIEEPTLSLHSPALRDGAIALAADESLHSSESWEALKSLLEGRKVSTLVLKPTAMGGLLACVRWAKRAEEHQINWVVSHTLEGNVGWAACAALCLAGPVKGLAAGLAPHEALDPHQALPGLTGSTIRLPLLPGLGCIPESL